MVDKYSSTENIRKIIYLDAPSPNDLLKFNFFKFALVTGPTNALVLQNVYRYAVT